MSKTVPVAEAYVPRHCRWCGALFVKKVLRVTFDEADGHKIILFDYVCPRGAWWKPWNWFTH